LAREGRCETLDAERSSTVAAAFPDRPRLRAESSGSVGTGRAGTVVAPRTAAERTARRAGRDERLDEGSDFFRAVRRVRGATVVRGRDRGAPGPDRGTRQRDVRAAAKIGAVAAVLHAERGHLRGSGRRRAHLRVVITLFRRRIGAALDPRRDGYRALRSERWILGREGEPREPRARADREEGE